MTLDELNTAHRSLMDHLMKHAGGETFAEDVMTMLAGMAAEAINNLAEPGHEECLAGVFAAMTAEKMENMRKEAVH